MVAAWEVVIPARARCVEVTRSDKQTWIAHLHHPWCRTTPETIEHSLLQCPCFHSHHTALRSRVSALAITTLDLPTVLAASGIYPSRQPAVLCLTCAFLRKTSQLPHL
ncbi:hypothetical protein E2C01_047884 [Portunus trituberculatus]|uniref:Uncharacterized protein n=1 Tax=Portunus trituberculatus TaxID=210409 RepID=A0A5B7G8P2_PORTR|nr:hypothetical protein [Portunus trituberculatus]